jgi:hypothetical protein
MTQNKGFNPRSTKVTNPFVQAYLEKQAEKAKPVGDRQKIVNIVLGAVLVLNLTVLGILGWSARTTIVPHIMGGSSDQDMALGEAMSKIKQLEISVQNMRNNVEFHKNAYFKMEQEHETMKAALARALPAENLRETLASYPNALPLVTPDAATQALETAQSVQAVQAARDAAVAAQQSLPVQ